MTKISEEFEFCPQCKAVKSRDVPCPFHQATPVGERSLMGEQGSETEDVGSSPTARIDSDSQPCGEFCSLPTTSGGVSAGATPTALAQIDETPQGIELWMERRTRIQQALALGTLAFLEAGRLLNEARENADFAKLGLQSWAEYIDDLGIEPSRASRLQAVARFVEEHKLDSEFTRMAGETRLYMASLAVKRGKMEEWELKQLPEVGCHQLRAQLGYQEGLPRTFVCGNCGADYVCGKCGATAVKRIARKEG